jgi:hypothetical protein
VTRVIGAMLGVVLLAACSPGMEPAVRTARVYPAMGQFPDQLERDSHACAAWAQRENATASGFTGVLEVVGGAATGGGTPGYGFGQDGADRAYTVCMNGRGYSVYW